jgi:hypothetical protein
MSAKRLGLSHHAQSLRTPTGGATRTPDCSPVSDVNTSFAGRTRRVSDTIALARIVPVLVSAYGRLHPRSGFNGGFA